MSTNSPKRAVFERVRRSAIAPIPDDTWPEPGGMAYANPGACKFASRRKPGKG